MAGEKLRWGAVVFLVIIHLLGFYGIYYICNLPSSEMRISLWMVYCMYFGGMFSTTAGDHRYYTHHAYECGFLLQAFWFPFKASSFQYKTHEWERAHTLHHAYTDTSHDPYNATRGFWWGHILWILFWNQRPKLDDCPDRLRNNKLLKFQDRFFIPLEILFAGVVPCLISWSLGIGLIAGFWASAVRVMLQGHATGLVNGYAHTFGTQPYNIDDTSRDAWVSLSSLKNCAISFCGFIVAILTLGEGWGHNFHHKYSSDWRCGHEWSSPDITKWILWTLSKVGLVWNLKQHTTSDEQIRYDKAQLHYKLATLKSSTA